MAAADLDAIIRQLARQQHKALTTAVRARRDHFIALAAKARDTAGKQRFRQMAKHVLDEGTAAARRLQTSADNAADSYARATRKAAEHAAAEAAQAAAQKKQAKPKGAKTAKKT